MTCLLVIFRQPTACFEKENENLKNENVSLMSKLNDLCEGNTTLKNKIVLVEKQKEVALNENTSLKRKIIEKEKKMFLKSIRKMILILTMHYMLLLIIMRLNF